METIKLTKRYYDSDFEIQVKDFNKNEIKIFSPTSRHAGLGLHYDVTIFTDIDTYYLRDIGEIRDGLDKFFIEQFIDQNILVTSRREETSNGSYSYIMVLSKIEDTKTKIMNKLRELKSSKTPLIFGKFKSIEGGIIEVCYMGHQVGGSYTYDYEVTPGYIKTLEYESNRKVEWTGRKSGGIGHDIYTFKVFVDKVVDEKRENEVIIGQRYHIDTTGCGGQSPYAFRVSPGIEWAMMYSISENLNKNKEMPGLEIKSDKIVSIYGQDIFKIINDAWERDDSRPNSGRTHFKGTFDLIIPVDEFRMVYLKFYGDLNNGKVRLSFPRFSSPELEFKLEDNSVISRAIGYLPITIEIPEKIVEPKEPISKETKEKIKIKGSRKK